MALFEASISGDFSKGQEFPEQSLEICRQLKRPDTLAASLETLAWILNHQENYQQAENYWQESRKIAEQIGNHYLTAVAINFLGWSFCRNVH